MNIVDQVQVQYKKYGQSKTMSTNDICPCFFLHRKFKGENDLLMIFDTDSCHSCCKFCNLSNRPRISTMTITEQYLHVISEVRHSLSVLDRITLSNNGSILDERTVSQKELLDVLSASVTIKNVRRIVLETDFAFLDETRLKMIKDVLGNVHLNILTGFETYDSEIRNKVLGKKWTLQTFEKGLDILSKLGCDITAYILYKPEQNMSDDNALIEAEKSVNYLFSECTKRNMNVTFRINPMFAAIGSEWADIAKRTKMYSPPRLSDIIAFAKKTNNIASTYIGLSTENKSEDWGNYRANPDFSKELLIEAIEFNISNSMLIKE